jgi:drug/metabolite transporter (DMT)-like permease
MSPVLRATLIGCSAVLMWSFLSVLTVASGHVPPFQLTAMTFAIGGGLGVIGWIVRGSAARALRQPAEVWALGITGLFGYHALYFTALRHAPPAEAQLLNYLWPLLIVLFSALLPTERLKPHHLLGILLGVIGTVVLFSGRDWQALSIDHIPGYSAALLAAVVWAIYSVLSRRFGTVPTDVIAGFCLATAALSFVCHLLFETAVWPATLGQWLAIIALGLAPVGLAFYTWDFGVKHGDIRVLGTVSYAAPVLSTCYLVLAGYAPATLALALAAVLISLGGLVAAKDLLASRTKVTESPAPSPRRRVRNR